VAYPVSFDRAAYSVGVSRPSDPRFTWKTGGNSARENIALAGDPSRGPVTPIQRELFIQILCWRMRVHGWGPADVWRIVGHDEVAHPRGRKSDPQGKGWLPLAPIRAEVARRLSA
jgi:hypothetical protein